MRICKFVNIEEEKSTSFFQYFANFKCGTDTFRLSLAQFGNRIPETVVCPE